MTLDQAAMDQPQGPLFTIITKALAPVPRGEGDPPGPRRFRATASSTIEDAAGDELELRALEKLAQQFRRGVGVFMDHDRTTGSAFGVTDGAQIIQRGMDEKSGKPIWDLDIEGVVNTPNPRAEQLANSIDSGLVKLGASVTAWVRKHERKPGGRGMRISDVDAIEVSIVGVPENQRSWAQKAAMAVKSFYKNEEDSVADDIIEKQVDTGELPDDAGAEPKGADEAADAGDAPAGNGTEAAPEAAEGEDAQESAEESASEAETPAGETPDAPDGEDADPPVTEKAYEPEDVKELLGHVKGLVEALDKAGAVIVEKDAKIASLEAEIAKYKVEAGSISREVDEAKQVIEKVLSMPLQARTAGYVEEKVGSGSLWSSVSPDIANYLSKRSKLSNGN